jgi:hypothetical protein
VVERVANGLIVVGRVAKGVIEVGTVEIGTAEYKVSAKGDCFFNGARERVERLFSSY